jgi:hypothetical protein
MPHSVEWNKKYRDKGLILIGLYCNPRDPNQDIIAFCKQYKVDYANYKSGNVDGVPVRGLPHFILFDHKGKMIFDGHPMQADKILDDAIKAAPDWLTGEGPYKKLNALAQKVIARKELGKVLAELKTKYLNSDKAEEKAEAEKLAPRLTRYGMRLLKKAEAAKDKEPTVCYNLYKQTAELFKGDEIGDTAQKAFDELKKDKVFQDNLQADKEYNSIAGELEKMKPCAKCKSFNKSCDACRKKNPSFEALIQRGKGLVKKYPASPAAGKVKEILPVE